MSTGKRLAKRSIVGTRVVAPGDDGKYYAGMIQAVKTPASFPESNNCINLTPNTRYTVRFESKAAVGRRLAREYRDTELVGPGFRGLAGLQLQPGQRLFLTYNGREVCGHVRHHDAARDELHVLVHPPGAEAPLELRKKLEEIRLLESRKSARLADVDTDFARLADMATDRDRDRRRASTTIDVPPAPGPPGSRKRRPSGGGGGVVGGGGTLGDRDDMMDECNAALVLMSLSCSPNSPRPAHALEMAAARWGGRSSVSPGASSSSGSGSADSWRSSTSPSPSPPPPCDDAPPASCSYSDEGIAMDYHPQPQRRKKAARVVFECTWPGCGARTDGCAAIEEHIRTAHLGPRKAGESDHEEEFYYTERELASSTAPAAYAAHVAPAAHAAHAAAPPPTLSHRDMCRPPHEDPDYQRQLVGSYRQGLLSTLQQQGALSAAGAGPIAIPHAMQHAWSTSSHSPKHMRMSPSYSPYGSCGGGGGESPRSPAGRRPRSDNKKCRKVYGMEHRELWCTQCKWKKACTRFGD